MTDWEITRVSPDATHHLTTTGRPLYQARFDEVLKFHAPGLAPVRDASGAYHITADGHEAYQLRHLRTFGFYEGRAVVQSETGWFHIRTDGVPLYQERFLWCGNFQDGLCPVRDSDNLYFHIKHDGARPYEQRYRYAGDFRDGFAVVQRDDGRHSHIDTGGTLLHGKWFLDLDVFHKNHARACDMGGWHHVDASGTPLYQERFKHVEPFYNGRARVEGFDGSLSVIDETGNEVMELREPLRSQLEELSGDMVGVWRTQTIRAAVELGVFEALPASATDMEKSIGLPAPVLPRLMRALVELKLVYPGADGRYHTTTRGGYLVRSHPMSLAEAANHWGRDSCDAWSQVVGALRTSTPAFTASHGVNFFDWIEDEPDVLKGYHGALASYAKHDYELLGRVVDFSAHRTVLDAGGGSGELSFALLRCYKGLQATVMDRPEVIALGRVPQDLNGRCRYIAGDLFQRWPEQAEAVVLARVLHDWSDADALRILCRAREAMSRDGLLYLVEMVLDASTGQGGLLDLHMLVMTGGAERTLSQFVCLLGKAGFELIEVVDTGNVSSVIKARAI